MPWYVWVATLSLGIFAVGVICEGNATRRRLETVLNTYSEYIEASELLAKWQEARPFLYVSQCEYARSLVQKMIVAYMSLLTYDPKLDAKGLEHLYQLLDEPPPSHDPPLRKRKPPRRLSFLNPLHRTFGNFPGLAEVGDDGAREKEKPQRGLSPTRGNNSHKEQM